MDEAIRSIDGGWNGHEYAHFASFAGRFLPLLPHPFPLYITSSLTFTLSFSESS